MKEAIYHDVDVAEFAKRMQDDTNAVILDVRTPAEKQNGDIPGSILIDIMGSNFEQEIAQLDRKKSYYVYCRSGNRSGTACSYMSANGFEHLFNLKGGMTAWKSDQLN